MKYQVEYRSAGNPTWELDDVFVSLGEAISYATSEALLSTDFEHRVTKQVAVVTFPPLEDFL